MQQDVYRVEVTSNINCNCDPSVEEGYEILKHLRREELLLNSQTVELYVHEQQCTSLLISGWNLRGVLKGRLLLNANVWDFLRKHPECIPQEWWITARQAPLAVYFWGTEYRGPGGMIYIRYMRFPRPGENHPFFSQRALSQSWGSDAAAAVLRLAA